VLALVGACALAIGVPAAYASHVFSDVPDSHFAHAGSAALKGAGITGGCNAEGTLYCPDDNVTRGQMAAFLHRGLSRGAYAVGSISTPFTTTLQVVATLTVDVPGVAGSGNTQFVKLDAAGLLYDNDAACPCSGFWYITRDAGGNSQPNYSTAPAPGANSGLGFDTTPVTWIAAVPAGTTQTFRLRAARYASNTGNVFGWGSMTAATVPFGHTGTSALGPAGASPSLPTK